MSDQELNPPPPSSPPAEPIPSAPSASLPSDASNRLLELKKKLLKGKEASREPTPSPPAARPLTRASTPLAPVKLLPEPAVKPKEITLAVVAPSEDKSAASSKPAKKAGLTLRSLLGNRLASKQATTKEPTETPVPAQPVLTTVQPVAVPVSKPVTFSRLKEAPAHRAKAAAAASAPADEAMPERKLISLAKASSPQPVAQSVADVIARFEEHPPPALLAAASSRAAHPFGVVAKPPLHPGTHLVLPTTSSESVSAFINENRAWLKRNHGLITSDVPEITVNEFIKQHRQFLKHISTR